MVLFTAEALQKTPDADELRAAAVINADGVIGVRDTDYKAITSPLRPIGQVGDLAGFFDRVVLINLDRRKDRLAEMRDELERAEWPFRQPERFRAIDAAAVPTPLVWAGGSGAWGCMQSHRQILERAIMDGVDSLLVLEDDVMFCERFPERAAAFLNRVPRGWDQLMLGGQLFGIHSTKEYVADGVVRVVNCQRTHCYAINNRRGFMSALYSKWCASIGHCDHVMGPFQDGWRVYAPDPFLAGQRRNQSDINGRLNDTRFWQSQAVAAPVYLVRAPREAVAAASDRLHEDHGRLCQTLIAHDPVLALRHHVAELEREGEQMLPPRRVAIWHPELHESVIRTAIGDRLIVITAEKGDEIASNL